jgi:type II secretory pathway component PulM
MQYRLRTLMLLLAGASHSTLLAWFIWQLHLPVPQMVIAASAAILLIVVPFWLFLLPAIRQRAQRE